MLFTKIQIPICLSNVMFFCKVTIQLAVPDHIFCAFARRHPAEGARPRDGTIPCISDVVKDLFVSLHFTNPMKDERQTDIRIP